MGILERLQLRKMVHNWRRVRVSTVLSWMLKLLMIGLLPVEVYSGEYLFAIATVAAIVISIVPSFIQHNYDVTLPFELDLLITLSLFLHTFMGEGLNFYQKVWVWDQILHFYGSAVVGLLAFVTVYTLHYTKKLRLTLPLIAFFTITIAMAAGGIWEIGEFTVDKLFNRMTQDGLDDTMWDMVLDLLGAVIIAGLGLLYVKYSNIAERKRLARPMGEVFGLGHRIDRLKRKIKKVKKTIEERED
jgi:signal transduction histidine kinase